MAARMALTQTLVLAAALGAAPVALLTPSARALAADSKAGSYLVTNASDSAVRSGPDLAWYVVAQLEKGAVLRMESETDGWFQVAYPAGTPAVVKTTEGELKEDKGVVVLTRRSSLLAYNLLNPYMEDCYKRLFADQPLMPGTELKYIGPLENRRGELTGYKVVAPQGAEGFILPANVRPATPEEIRSFTGAAAKDDAPAKAAPQETPATAPGRTVTSNPDVREITPSSTVTPPPAAPVETADADKAHQETEQIDEIEVTEVDEVEVTEVDEIEMGAPAPRDTPPAYAAPRNLNDVDAAYKQVMKQDIENAEFSQLIAEYTAILNALPNDPSADLDRDYIAGRIEILTMRAEIQEDMRDLAALELEAASAQSNLDEFVHKIQIARGYIVVGRLSPSIIYDGDRLPTMFRVVSVDAASGGRTLAYVLPNPDLNLVGKLGSLVGVQGEDDPTAKRGEVRVIKPTVVDVLTIDSGAPAPAPARPTAVSDGVEIIRD